jgi:hypothetical protein
LERLLRSRRLASLALSDDDFVRATDFVAVFFKAVDVRCDDGLRDIKIVECPDAFIGTETILIALDALKEFEKLLDQNCAPALQLKRRLHKQNAADPVDRGGVLLSRCPAW